MSEAYAVVKSVSEGSGVRLTARDGMITTVAWKLTSTEIQSFRVALGRHRQSQD